MWLNHIEVICGQLFTVTEKKHICLLVCFPMTLKNFVVVVGKIVTLEQKGSGHFNVSCVYLMGH